MKDVDLSLYIVTFIIILSTNIIVCDSKRHGIDNE